MHHIRQMIILAGGKGTRLGEHTRSVPKPLMRITDNTVFLDYLIDNVARQGFQDIIIVAGHFGDQIRQRYDNVRVRAADISVLIEPEPRGTGGALAFARDQLAGAFLVTNGDTYLDGNFRAVAAALQNKPSLEGVMALRAVDDVSRYGSVSTDTDGTIREFVEKSAEQAGQGGLINAGTYALRQSVLDRILSYPVSIESDIFPLMAKDSSLGSVLCDGYFIDIGLPETLGAARSILPSRKRPVLFLDRDGVLNHDINYLHRRDQWVWIDGAREAIRMANDLGIAVVVVTNQAGIARGYYDEAALQALHLTINAELKMMGAFIDAFYYCPYHPDAADEVYRIKTPLDRKPMPTMLMRAIQHHDLDPNNALFVGDQDTDQGAADSAGVPFLRFDGSNLCTALANCRHWQDLVMRCQAAD